MRDFTFKKYQELLYAIHEMNYKVYTIADYYDANEKKSLEAKYVVLRHDVDGNVQNALKMAKLENHLGFTATYYFRMKGRLFVPDVVKKISDLGHEIGYHYEHLPDAKGDIEEAKKIFELNLNKLRELADVKTACMHGRPFSKYDSRDFWKYYKLRDFGLKAEPYMNLDYKDKFYFTDTGQAWDNTKFNIRDLVLSKGNMDVQSTDDLIKLFASNSIDKSAMLIHTNRWVDELPIWIFYTLGNKTVNVLKMLLKKMIGNKGK